MTPTTHPQSITVPQLACTHKHTYVVSQYTFSYRITAGTELRKTSEKAWVDFVLLLLTCTTTATAAAGAVA